MYPNSLHCQRLATLVHLDSIHVEQLLNILSTYNPKDQHIRHHFHFKTTHHHQNLKNPMAIAKSILISSKSQLTMSISRGIVFIQLFLLFVFFSSSEAREFLVGGSPNSWKTPSSEPDALDKWAEEIRFRIGDSLVWKYEGGKDSVLQVTKDAYLTCNTSNPVAEYNDGNTTINLTRSGPYYFISGAPGHCEKGQKLTVIVLSTKHSASTPAPAPASAPASGLPQGHASNLKGSQLVMLGTLVGLGYLMI